MELVLLQDVQSSFGSNWARVANTSGVREIQIGDRFREQGFGPGAEELEVAGVDISPVGGMSRLFFNRGGNATKPEVHRLGAVLEQVGIKVLALEVTQSVTTVSDSLVNGKPIPLINKSEATAVTNQPTNGSASAVPVIASADDEPLVPVAKRRRGRPPGSKNRTKAQTEVALPAGFE